MENILNLKKIALCFIALMFVGVMQAQKDITEDTQENIQAIAQAVSDNDESYQIKMSFGSIYVNGEKVSYEDYNAYVREACPGAYPFDYPNYNYILMNKYGSAFMWNGVYSMIIGGAFYYTLSGEYKMIHQTFLGTGAAFVVAGVTLKCISWTHRYRLMSKSVKIYSNRCGQAKNRLVSKRAIELNTYVGPGEVGFALNF